MVQYASVAIPEDFGKQLFAAGEMPFVPYIPAIIDRVVVGSSAEAAGLLANDQIIVVDGTAINPWHPTTSPPDQVSNAFKQRQAEKLVIQISRDNIISEIEIQAAMETLWAFIINGHFQKQPPIPMMRVRVSKKDLITVTGRCTITLLSLNLYLPKRA
jgi:membrane-associated protease RseP (regulator of RpoE activity)